jgi:DNA (cytosine-5)-methyltransferase 1
MSTFVSLFAGVGGFDLGFERAGHTCVGQVEIDKHAQKILKKHWPDVPMHDDVTTAIKWAKEMDLIGRVDIVCGGFPCQDVSVAGKRAGAGVGTRSGLFWDAIQFAQEVKAQTIVLENVPGLLSSNNGRDFGVVLTELANAGYGHIEWRVLDSQFFGVPQRRRRVFIVGSTIDRSRQPVLIESESGRGNLTPSKQPRKKVTRKIADSARTAGWLTSTDATTSVTSKWHKGTGGPSGSEHFNLVVEGFTPSSFANYQEGTGTLRANGGDLGGGSETLLVRSKREITRE